MSRKSADKGSKPNTDSNQSHRPARHIVETARLASSVQVDKNPKKVRQAAGTDKPLDR
jgi:hypothetical protein